MSSFNFVPTIYMLLGVTIGCATTAIAAGMQGADKDEQCHVRIVDAKEHAWMNGACALACHYRVEQIIGEYQSKDMACVCRIDDKRTVVEPFKP